METVLKPIVTEGNKRGLTLAEKIADILSTTCITECYNKHNKLLRLSDTYRVDMQEINFSDRVVYRVLGNLGDDLGNPEVTFGYFDNFRPDTKPTIRDILKLFIVDYRAMCLLYDTVHVN